MLFQPWNWYRQNYSIVQSQTRDSLKTTTLELAFTFIVYIEGLSWWWSYGSWIYNYLYNQCLSPTKLRVWISLMARCTDLLETTLCDKVFQWQWVSLGTPVSSTNKTDRHDITIILFKVVLNIIILTLYSLLMNINENTNK
jgi:hypothetical protein